MKKSLPYSEKHEQSLISCMMLEPMVEGKAVVEEFGDRNPFFMPTCARIYDAFHRINIENISVITIADYMSNTGISISTSDLREACNYAPSVAHFQLHLSWVKKLDAQREMLKGMSDIVHKLHDPKVNIESVAEDANVVIASSASTNDGGMVSAGHAADSLYENIESGEDGYPTGFIKLDTYLAPIPPGSMVIIAARPKIGKTALAVNMAVNLARAGYPIGINSMEMPAEQLSNRMIAIMAGVDSSRKGFKTVMNTPEVLKAKAELATLPIFISCEKDWSKQKRIIRSWTAQKQIKYWFIDHIGLVETRSNSNRSRENEVSEISKGVKGLAMELNNVMVPLCQLNRECEGFRPKLNNLRESGSLEQDADAVIFLHNARASDSDILAIREGKSVDTIIDVAAHRHGDSGYYTAQFYKRSGLFRDGVNDEDVPR